MQPLEDEHLENQESGLSYDEEENLQPQKVYENKYQQKPQTQLENVIMEKISSEGPEQDTISRDLQIKLEKLIESILFSEGNSEEKMRMRMHELALSKILVHTHGKSEFYLVKAHHHLGEAYLNYKCYEQALDHLTLSLKKNAKLKDMKEVKLYHSFVLTTYSRCYFEISSFEDALEILKKAYDIQASCKGQDGEVSNEETLKLISNCYLKLKDYPNSLEFIEMVLAYLDKKQGPNSIKYAKAKIDKSKIFFSQSEVTQAISELEQAIEIMSAVDYDKKVEIADVYDLLASYYEKSQDLSKQIQSLEKKHQILVHHFEEGHDKALKVKRTIASLLFKCDRVPEAINAYEEILQNQEKFHSENRLAIGKTLKSLGMCNLALENKQNEAESYLKRALKHITDCGVPKMVKEVKQKLQQLKEQKENQSQAKEEFKNIGTELKNQPTGVAY